MRLILWLPFLLLPIGAFADNDSEGQAGKAKLEAGDEKPPTTLRLMTYNIHHGEGTDGKFDLERLAKIISGKRVDLVAVQEVDVKTKRSSGVDQAAELARLTGMHYAFGKFMDYQGGEYGQMVLSKFPIIKARNLALPPGPEPRTALAINVEVPGPDGATEIVFVGNHFYASERERSAQAERLTELLDDELKAKVPIILAGDFNSTPKTKPMKILSRYWIDPTERVNDRTWPSKIPRVEIDYILYFPADRFLARKSKVLVETKASDHRPVFTILELKPPPAE